MNPDDDNDNNEQNENIRAPDPVIRETLLGSTSNNYGYNINHVNNNYYDSIFCNFAPIC